SSCLSSPWRILGSSSALGGPKNSGRQIASAFLRAWSIFITDLAFVGEPEVINASKMAIFLASLPAGVLGFVWLKVLGKPLALDTDMDTMDFEENKQSPSS